MTVAAYVLASVLRSVCYFILFLDIYSRVLPWFGAENTFTGRCLRVVSNILSYPFRVILKGFTDRHPTAVDIPALLGSVFILLVAGLSEI